MVITKDRKLADILRRSLITGSPPVDTLPTRYRAYPLPGPIRK